MIRRVVLTGVVMVVVLLALTAAAMYWLLSGDGVRRAFEDEASTWLGQPVQIAEADVAWLPRISLRLRDVRVGEPARMTLSAVDLTIPLGTLLSRRIDNADVSVSDSRVDMPLPLALPAPGQNRPAAGSTSAAGIELVSIRKITLRDITMVSRAREIVVSADLSLDQSRLEIDRFTAMSGTMALEAGGYAELLPRVNVTVEATASALEVDELFALAAAFMGEPGTNRQERSARIFARVSSPQAHVGGLELKKFTATMIAEGGLLTVDPLSFDVFGGRQDGWLDAQIGETLLVRIGARVANVDVAQLAAFGGAPPSITGRLTGSGRFGASGSDLGSILGSIRGVGQAVIADGSLRGLDVARKAVGLLGIPPPAEATAGSERFDEILGTFAFGDRAIHSDDLVLRAPDYDIFAKGGLTFGTMALDARADLVLSEALSAQARRDVYRYARAGTRIVLPVTVGGTLARPQFGIDAAAAATRGAQNEIQRRLDALLERVKPF